MGSFLWNASLVDFVTVQTSECNHPTTKSGGSTSSGEHCCGYAFLNWDVTKGAPDYILRVRGLLEICLISTLKSAQHPQHTAVQHGTHHEFKVCWLTSGQRKKQSKTCPEQSLSTRFSICRGHTNLVRKFAFASRMKSYRDEKHFREDSGQVCHFLQSHGTALFD